MSTLYNSFIKNNIAPYRAKSIGLISPNGEILKIGLNSLNRHYGDRLYRFGVISDSHNSESRDLYDFNITDFKYALELFNSKEKVEFVCSCGDLVTDGSESQFTTFKECKDEFPDLPLFAAAGNHDIQSGSSSHVEIWKNYVGHENGKINETTTLTNSNKLPYQCFELTKTLDNSVDHFLFLGLTKWSTKYNGGWYSEESISWLESKLKEYEKERCFIFMHLFIPTRSGNYANKYAIANWLDDATTERLNKLIDKYNNTIWFSGHSHWKWDRLMYETNANIHYTKRSGYTVHIPSCAYVRTDNDYNNPNDNYYIDTSSLNSSEIAVVDVYENYIDIRGIDGANNRYLPIAQYRLYTPNIFGENTKIEKTPITEPEYDPDNPTTTTTSTTSTTKRAFASVKYTIYNRSGYSATISNSTYGASVSWNNGNTIANNSNSVCTITETSLGGYNKLYLSNTNYYFATSSTATSGSSSLNVYPYNNSNKTYYILYNESVSPSTTTTLAPTYKTATVNITNWSGNNATLTYTINGAGLLNTSDSLTIPSSNAGKYYLGGYNSGYGTFTAPTGYYFATSSTATSGSSYINCYLGSNYTYYLIQSSSTTTTTTTLSPISYTTQYWFVNTSGDEIEPTFTTSSSAITYTTTYSTNIGVSITGPVSSYVTMTVPIGYLIATSSTATSGSQSMSLYPMSIGTPSIYYIVNPSITTTTSTTPAPTTSQPN